MKAFRRLLRPLKQWFNRVVRIDAGIFLSKPIEPHHATDSHDRSVREVTGTACAQGTFPYSAEHFASRLANGNRFYEFFVGQELVAYGWLAGPGTQVGILHDLKLVVPPSAAYVWDVATKPAHRGRGHIVTLIEGMLSLNRVETRVAWTAVAIGNRSSRRALAKAGFSPMFTYFSAQLFGTTLISLVVREGRLTKAQPVFDRLGQEPSIGLE